MTLGRGNAFGFLRDVGALSARSEDNRLRLSSGSGIFSIIVDVIAFVAVAAIAICFYLVAAAIVVVVVAIAVIVVATIVFVDEGWRAEQLLTCIQLCV